MPSMGTRTGEGRRADSEEERDFWSAEVPRRAAPADGEIAEAQAVESPLRHHLKSEGESGFSRVPLFYPISGWVVGKVEISDNLSK